MNRVKSGSVILSVFAFSLCLYAQEIPVLVRYYAPGDYEYKFFIDGHNWITDPENPRVIPGYNNSGCLVTNPMIYYVKPMKGTVFLTEDTVFIEAYFSREISDSLNLSGTGFTI